MKPNSFVEFNAHGWPFGAALIRLTPEPVSPTATRVRMAETLSPGIGRLTPMAMLWQILHPRNSEARHRLDDIAADRKAAAQPTRDGNIEVLRS